MNKITDGRISFAYEEMIQFPVEMVKLLWEDITHMDLSGNNISNFEFLYGFSHLKSLIVDGNLSIGSKKTRLTFPTIPNLELFYCNNCDISDSTSEFIIHISALFPKIKYLSLMDWKTVVADEKSLNQLRMLAIFMNPFLVHFNDKLIGDDERDLAKNIQTFDCKLPLNLIDEISRDKSSAIKKDFSVTQEIKDFFEAENIEKKLSLITMTDYLFNF